ncbi:TPA: host cell division inhibitory peptide Kil [Escherichia coli]|nr:host cell division inhibitory peptide Kil [Escherichia coli]
MVVLALQQKLLIAAYLHDAAMWEEANKSLYVILTAKNASE